MAMAWSNMKPGAAITTLAQPGKDMSQAQDVA